MMDDMIRPWERTGSVAQRQAVMSKVLGLLGVAFLCTAIGAVIGPRLGPAAFLLSLVGSIGTLIALYFAKEKSPANLWLLYTFSTFEGMLLGLVVEGYIARGMGAAVLNAAGTTGAITMAAGLYGVTTKRDLTGFGNVLMIGLIGVVIASIVGIFIQLPALYLMLSAVSAALFTGFLVFDLNRVANAQDVTEGDTILLAVSVYLDIFNLFLALLHLFGFFNNNNDD